MRTPRSTPRRTAAGGHVHRHGGAAGQGLDGLAPLPLMLLSLQSLPLPRSTALTLDMARYPRQPHIHWRKRTLARPWREEAAAWAGKAPDGRRIDRNSGGKLPAVEIRGAG